MSNRLSRARKGDKKPSVRQDEFINSIRMMDDKIQRLNYMLAENIYLTRDANTKFNYFVQYLTKKGVIEEKDYKDYVEDLNKKMKLAEEISKDESLSREDKLNKAKENDIPEEWVVQPEEKQVAEIKEETEGSASKETEQNASEAKTEESTA